MAPKCCVPGCSSNYERTIKETGYITVFRFPTDEDKAAAWRKAIPRKNWTPSKYAVVCIKHFEERDLDNVDVSVDTEGNIQEFARNRTLLKADAVPRIFPGLPKHLNNPSAHSRVDPALRRERQLKVLEEKQNQWLENDSISSFQNFLNKIREKSDYSSKWKLCVESSFVCFYVLQCKGIPSIAVSVVIQEDLKVQVCVKNQILSASQLSWILPTQKLQRWSQLQNLLARYVDTDDLDSNRPNVISELERMAFSYMRLLSSEQLVEEKVNKQLLFLLEQIVLVLKKKRNYTCETILFAFLLYEQSASSYNVLRHNILALPHPKYMQSLSRKLCLPPNVPSENRNYLETACSRLSEREKYVIVQLDEIYVQEKLSFRNGTVMGFAENQPACSARTVLAFMIASAFGHLKEVVSLFPVRNLTGLELLELTLKVLAFITSCGFKVLIIVSDNNRLNRSMFAMLNNQPSVNFNTPFSPYTFDFVHIFKCIRNNWLNVKDVDKTFTIPDFDNPVENVHLRVKFSVIRDLYKSERNKLVKTAPKLNHKTVYPSNIERQKVSLVDNIFHETTISALKLSESDSGTLMFLEIIHKWWKIVNIRSPMKGTLKRNPLELPFSTVDDERLKFIDSFLKWLEVWNKMSVANNGSGFLSKDTFFAMYHATKTIKEIIVYSLNELKVPYVLPGKFETDGLENRFSSYRQLSGGNYNVSVEQILDSEKKIRIKKHLGIHSAKYGRVNFVVTMLEFVNVREPIEVVTIEQVFLDSILTEYFTTDFDIDMSALIYVSGYVAHKVLKYVDCSWCSLYIASETTADSYFNDLNRGGLSVPSEVTLHLGWCMFKVLQILISPQFEPMFLEQNNQKVFYLSICCELIKVEESLQNDTVCICQTSSFSVLNMMLPYFANVLISNYTKLRNDSCRNNKLGNKRKLSTFM